MTNRPWRLLPTNYPKEEEPELGYFYDNVAKHLVKDTVRVMQNGLPIDLNKVQELEKTLDETIAKVHETLEDNRIVRQYQEARYESLAKSYKEERLSKCRSPDYYLKPFKHNDMNHRSLFMKFFSESLVLSQPEELLPIGFPKWTANQVKKLAKTKPVLQKLLNGEVTELNNKFAKQAVEALAEIKAEIYNRSYIQQAETLKDLSLPPFNPGSPDQKHDILTDILGYESNKLTDAYVAWEREAEKAYRNGYPEPEPPRNKFSWNRENLELLLEIAKNKEEKELFQSLIDYSMGSIIKNNFIQAFYNYTVEGRLYGQYKLLGAKSGRYTSSNP